MSFERTRAATCVVLERSLLGTGVLVAADQVLTCGHVVQQASGAGLSVRFPWSADGLRFDAPVVAVVKSIQHATDGSDLALLKLDCPILDGDQRLLPLAVALTLGSYVSWGFRSSGDGRLDCGLPDYGTVVTDTVDRGQRVLYLDAKRIDRGMSGAAVVQGNPPRLVGLTTSSIDQREAGLVLPLDQLLAVFDGLTGLATLPVAIAPGAPGPSLRMLPSRQPSPVFVGRGVDLLRLDAELSQRDCAVVQAAITGLAGIGKTELALQYVHRMSDPGRYPGGVIWLDGRRDLRSEWLRVAYQFGVDLAEREPAAVEAEVLRRLGERERVLLVLDSLERPAELDGHLPDAASGHAVLVTSRTREFGGRRFAPVELNVLDAAASAELLRAVMGERATRHPEDVDALVTALRGHALALEVAGAYLRRNPQVEVAGFLKRVVDPDLAAGAALDETAYGRTFAQMMDEIAQQLAPEARGLFALLGLYGDAPGPIALLRSTWGRLKRTEFDAALGELRDQHLIESDEATWSSHRLVRAAAERQLAAQAPETAEHHRQALADHLEQMDDYALNEYFSLEPHVLRVAESSPSPGRSSGIGEAALYLYLLGRSEEARVWMEQALDEVRGRLGERHFETANGRSNLALILRDLGDLAGAQRETEVALDIDLELLGPRHPNVAIHRSNLGLILMDLGDLAGARRETEVALDIDVEVLGAGHREVATDRSNLATILRDLGDLAGARGEAEAALDIDLEVFGPRHARVGTLRANLATILKDLGDLVGARCETEVALDIGLETLGPRHPTVALRRSNLAIILQELGDLAGARRQADEAVSIAGSLPEGSPVRSTVLSRWAANRGHREPQPE